MTFILFAMLSIPFIALSVYTAADYYFTKEDFYLYVAIACGFLAATLYTIGILTII